MHVPLAAVPTIPGTGFEVPVEVLALGVVTGMTYSILAVGLVLVYRSSRVINFAHGEMGALAAGIVPVMVAVHGISYWLALPLALLIATAAGVVTEYLVVRKLTRAPRLITLVATIGMSQVFFGLGTFIPKGESLGSVTYPTPFTASVTIGTLHLNAGQLLILVVVPLVTFGLHLFLRHTNVGLASRASAENQDAARLVGIPVKRISRIVWIVAGLTAGAAAVLLGPTQPIVVREALGPDLLLRALAAAMIGGMVSLPMSFVGGLVVGVVELAISWNYPAGGMLQLALLAVILVSFFVRRDLGVAARKTERSSWSLAGALRDADPGLLAHPRVRWVRRAVPVIVLAVALLVPFVLDNSQRVTMSTVALFAIMALSLTVLTGYAGQVSLGQFAFVAIGAVVGGRAMSLGFPFWMGATYAVLVGGALALVVGLPALRIRGLFLAVVTLAFAVAVGAAVFNQEWLVRGPDGSSSLKIPRPDALASELRYTWLCVLVLAAVAWMVRHLRETGFGRAMTAVRDNEIAAATLSISPRRAKLAAFVLSGAIASGAGFLYGGLLVNFASEPQETFAPILSLVLVATVIVGGVTTVTGAIAGVVGLRGIGMIVNPYLPQLFGSSVALMLAGAGMLIAVLQFPGGVAGELFRLRDRLFERLAGAAPERLEASERARGLPRPRLGVREAPNAADAEPEPAHAAPALEARDVVVRYGGNVALDGVSLTAAPDEIVGLVGPNGAGKTTLFDVLGGQLRPDTGRVSLRGQDVTWLRPEERALLGLGRTFQQAELFAEMTVLDAFKVALERDEPSEALPSLLGLPPARASEKRKHLRAVELVELLGLEPYAHLHVGELSTGMRRIAELGAVVALGADVLLLDEPTAGIAQREVEAFRPVLTEIRDHLGATVVVIEHDLPMVVDLVDRLYVLSSGQLLAEGPPSVLRTDERVVAAYLGSDDRVILRSGATT